MKYRYKLTYRYKLAYQPVLAGHKDYNDVQSEVQGFLWHKLRLRDSHSYNYISWGLWVKLTLNQQWLHVCVLFQMQKNFVSNFLMPFPELIVILVAISPLFHFLCGEGNFFALSAFLQCCHTQKRNMIN